MPMDMAGCDWLMICLNWLHLRGCLINISWMSDGQNCEDLLFFLSRTDHFQSLRKLIGKAQRMIKTSFLKNSSFLYLIQIIICIVVNNIN